MNELTKLLNKQAVLEKRKFDLKDERDRERENLEKEHAEEREILASKQNRALRNFIDEYNDKFCDLANERRKTEAEILEIQKTTSTRLAKDLGQSLGVSLDMLSHLIKFGGLDEAAYHDTLSKIKTICNIFATHPEINQSEYLNETNINFIYKDLKFKKFNEPKEQTPQTIPQRLKSFVKNKLNETFPKQESEQPLYKIGQTLKSAEIGVAIVTGIKQVKKGVFAYYTDGNTEEPSITHTHKSAPKTN